jgi:hypothetical protein
MKSKVTLVATLLFALGTVASKAEFKAFELILNNQTGTLIASEEQIQWNPVSFGVVLDDSGNPSRVEYGSEEAIAQVSGKYVNEHGMGNLNVTFAVDGPVIISVGQCQFSSNEITVKNSQGEVVVKKTPTAACWCQDKTHITELYYMGEAETLTVSGMAYCAYIAVAANENPVARYDISFTMGSETAEGSLPTATTWTEGDSYQTPTNFTLYKEGYTLTGWNDGTKTVGVGQAYTPTDDVTLTPVFQKNTKNLATRETEATIRWDFQRKNGAPTVAVEGKQGLWVTQSVVDGETIDVKLDYDATKGKIANASWSDWAQMNAGTKFTIPSAEGAVVSMEAFNEISTTTIDGVGVEDAANNIAGYTKGRTISHTVTNAAESIEIVIGDGSYYRYIQVVLPEVQAKEYAVTFAEAAEGFATFCPAVNVAIPEGVSAFTAVVKDATLVLSPLSEVIPAGTGVILKGKVGDTAQFTETDAEAEAVADNQLSGTVEETEVSGVYVLSSGEAGVAFYKYSGTKIQANKAYLSASVAQSAPMLRFDYSGTEGNDLVTGIDKVTVNEHAAQVIYNFSGRRLKSATQPGCYIINGKKIILK